MLDYVEDGDNIRWIRDQQNAETVAIYRNSALEVVVDYRFVGGSPSSIRINDPSSGDWIDLNADGTVTGHGLACINGICPESSECDQYAHAFMGAASAGAGFALATMVAGLVTARIPPAVHVAKQMFTMTQASAGAAAIAFGTWAHCRRHSGGGSNPPPIMPI